MWVGCHMRIWLYGRAINAIWLYAYMANLNYVRTLRGSTPIDVPVRDVRANFKHSTTHVQYYQHQKRTKIGHDELDASPSS